MFNKTFWTSALERALKTFAQAGVALLLGDGLNLLTVDWATVGATAGLAAVVSLLTSVGSAPFGPEGSPSLVDTASTKS